MKELASLDSADAAHLERARRLARQGWGHVNHARPYLGNQHPNPLVGCVIVGGEGVVGEGYHADFGGPHAEIVALDQARGRAAGATV
jgi:diaminohydroxyphosphoribosylaminopyrimidine deaminase/5-amino-6-(5-phosphoribosylamino)uracil reductase